MGMSLGSNPHDEDEDDFTYRPLAEINVTPFVDVMLVLLIIFMVTAPLMMTGVSVDLPDTSASAITPPKQPMVVTLTKDGEIYIRDERVERLLLNSRLSDFRNREGDQMVYVRADRANPYGDVMEILARVGEGGFTKISLLARSEGTTEISPPIANEN